VAALPGARARFLREGEAASRIRHPNVVDVTDVGTEGATAYLVMEFLEGEDLASLIERTGGLPVAQAADILVAVVAAIGVAHEEGVIHRDLKPGNIFMARSRHGGLNPTVLDFGISKLTSGSGNTLALTGTGASMGTPYYVAPEQIRSAAGADGQSDQYALGAILYECVTGQRAHQGETLYDVIRSVGDGNFPPPHVHRPDIPPALEQAILRAMRLNPAERFPSVQAFGRAILPFASPEAKARWGQALGGGGAGGAADARAASTMVAAPQAGGTVILPTPAPGFAAPKTNSTFGSSVGEMAPRGRSRSGLVAGGLILLGGGAVGAYLMLAATPRKPTVDANLTAVEGAGAAVPTAPARKPPARYRLDVTVSPGSAHLDLDGHAVGTGSIDQSSPPPGSSPPGSPSAIAPRPKT
jgi:serine/threonine-protein kinase